MLEKVFSVSFRCYYANGNKTNHRQDLKLSEIPRWIDSYQFTHPHCLSITCKVYFTDNEKPEIED